MANKLELTPRILEEILARIPEGFIHRDAISAHMKVRAGKALDRKLASSTAGRIGNIFYDKQRLTREQARELSQWCQPEMPPVNPGGMVPGIPITERLAMREQQMAQADAPDYVRIIRALENRAGFATVEMLCEQPGDETVLQNLIEVDVLRQSDNIIYDPLRLGFPTVHEVKRRIGLLPLQQEIIDFLKKCPGHTAPYPQLAQQYDTDTFKDILAMGALVSFYLDAKVKPYSRQWVYPIGSDEKQARKAAQQALSDEMEGMWGETLSVCGEVLRPGAHDGKKNRIRVLARSYTLKDAAKRLGVRHATLERAVKTKLLSSFIDPANSIRIPAEAVEIAFADTEQLESIAALEVLKAREIALVSGASYSTARQRLKRANISATDPQWGQIRGRWKLPATLSEFREILKNKEAALTAERAEQQRLIEEERAAERRRRDELRARLVAAFPTWKHEGRVDQRIILHIGPPNSGKTHDALITLAEAGSGWYLAPLRLLAFEVFDRLNQRGVLCNLLTGEEQIPVEGARITAATIEMFMPVNSGGCVVIDEAQMLADPDRGWAWTRALMEARAPDIHVIGPPTSQRLIEQLAEAAAIPITVIDHERLAPIQIAETHWPLDALPPHTILVAFSRRMVLHLKTELENLKRRVSVVYGSLPPEVRRKQADRFADGETDICVATDAVGMGLNLPADYVCFFEVEKYDGAKVRMLTPSEVHQIGGRAGRYGFSTAGEIGATERYNLHIIRRLYRSDPPQLTHARVAPSVQDLEMIPGSLWEKLTQWAMLQSIPDSLRNVIKTANLTERIELAKMLTDAEVDQLGLDVAMQLTNAPARQGSRAYWYSCAQAILRDRYLPLPPAAPYKIANSTDLETMEMCISCADIYLWLSNRREFRIYGGSVPEVAESRFDWSMRIDAALLRQIDTAQRCVECGRPLPVSYRYRVCEKCYSRRFLYDDIEDDW